MSDTVHTVGDGPLSQHTSDGLTTVSNSESAEAMEENFASEPKPRDGEAEDPEEAERKDRAKAAAKLGKAGGKAAAEAREKVDKEPEKPKVEAKPKEEKAEAKPDDKGKAEPEPEPKRRGDPRFDARARVMEATRELAEERKARKAAEDRAAALEAKANGKEATPVKEGAAGPKKPEPKDYETYEEYVEALADHRADQRLAKFKEEQAAKERIDAAARAASTRSNGFRERMDKAVAEDPTFKERIDEVLLKSLLPTWALPPGQAPDAANDLAAAIVDSEEAPAILLHLSDHPEEYEAILALPDSAAVGRAVGRLEAKLAKSDEEPAKEKPKAEPAVSRAKPPARSISGAPAGGDEDVDDETSFEEHVRIMNARDARARRAR